MNEIKSLPIQISSLDTSWMSCEQGMPSTLFDDFSRRVSNFIQAQSQPKRSLKRFFFSCRFCRCEPKIDPTAVDLDQSIEMIFASFSKRFDEASSCILLHSGEGRLLASNALYSERLGRCEGQLGSLMQDLDERVTIRGIIQYDEDTRLTIQMTRSKIFNLQGRLVYMMTQIQQVNRGDPSAADLQLEEVDEVASSGSAQQVEEVDPLTAAKDYMKSKHVLIVDDTASQRKMTERMLKSNTNQEIRCTIVDDGSEAVDLFERGEMFDCVLMDLEMPMRGTIATEKIRKIVGCAEVPIIAWTSNTKEVCEEQIQKAGMTAYCFKHTSSLENLFLLMSRLIRENESQDI